MLDLIGYKVPVRYNVICHSEKDIKQSQFHFKKLLQLKIFKQTHKGGIRKIMNEKIGNVYGIYNCYVSKRKVAANKSTGLCQFQITDSILEQDKVYHKPFPGVLGNQNFRSRH